MSSSLHWRSTIERSRMFWYARQTVITGGTSRIENISEYAMVIAGVVHPDTDREGRDDEGDQCVGNTQQCHRAQHTDEDEHDRPHSEDA